MAVESFDASDVTSVDDLKGFSTPSPGQYHLAVVSVDESREKGNAVIVRFVILAGTTPGQENRLFNNFFNDPSSTSKDGGAFVRKIRLALLMSTGIITPDMLGKSFNFDWQSLLQRQLKAAVVTEKKDDGKVYAKIDGINMWGPLDEEAKHIPHDMGCIEGAIRSGQVNVVGKAAVAAPGAAVAATIPKAAASVTAQVGLPAAVDKYAGL